jgi:hypothetical protein
MTAGIAVQFPHAPGHRPHGHETAGRVAVTRRLARILGLDYSGLEYAPDRRNALPAAGRVYYVPDDTLEASEALLLGICSESDLFGGVVPHAYMKSKAIAHALADEGGHAPPGWRPRLAERLRELTLPGYSAFSPADAVRAVERVLALGPARAKLGEGVGGGGQARIQHPGDLEALARGMDAEHFARLGMVVELNLEDEATYSVGVTRVQGLSIAYCGVQKSTCNHAGQSVYGGSDLLVVRGDFAELLREHLPSGMAEAADKARRFDAIVEEEVPGFFASRRNYDVILGRDADDLRRGGVLEQSWRVGGASPAEAAALEAFHAEPELRVVSAACMEVYGGYTPPPGAEVYFDGVDEQAGRLIKYCILEREA